MPPSNSRAIKHMLRMVGGTVTVTCHCSQLQTWRVWDISLASDTVGNGAVDPAQSEPCKASAMYRPLCTLFVQTSHERSVTTCHCETVDVNYEHGVYRHHVRL